MQASAFHKLLLLLPLAFFEMTNGSGDWDYLSNGKDWGDLCATGKLQSPIALDKSKAVKKPMPKVWFGHNTLELRRPLWLKNNGHTINMDIPTTIKGWKPFIAGGRLRGRYYAVGMHIHWGSKNSPGAEHSLNKFRYDAEVHIVCYSSKYNDIVEAVEHKGGIAVVAIFLAIERKNKPDTSGLRKFIDASARIPYHNSNTTIPGVYSLNDLMGNPDLEHFYSYDGSLTTPGCHESVIWTVFSTVERVYIEAFGRLWKLLDHSHNKLINNFRTVQALNNRTVYYR
ncbi:carbonic anhydrase 6-like [Drosophila teissieri]|uniref:carbonic anhydrase 6-like n=1 Tax=Drosophila teissieri TaxID=7243 RepID=UPI001CB9E6CB|nr:carbonic anhydrase 6-like [Drosophila teissieri]